MKRSPFERIISTLAVTFVLAMMVLTGPWQWPRTLVTGAARDACWAPLLCDVAQLVALGAYVLVGLGLLALTLSTLCIALQALGLLGRGILGSRWRE